MTINGLYQFKKIMPSKKLLISHSWNLSSSLHSDFWQVSSSVPVTKHTDIFLFVCFNLISFFVIFLRSELYVLCINLTLLSRVPNSSDRMVLISVPLPGVGHEIKRYKVLFGSFWWALSNKTFGLLDSSIFRGFFLLFWLNIGFSVHWATSWNHMNVFTSSACAPVHPSLPLVVQRGGISEGSQ